MNGQPRALIRQIVFHLENNTFLLPHVIFSLPLPPDLTHSNTHDTTSVLGGKVRSRFFFSGREDITEGGEDMVGGRLFLSRPTLCLARSLRLRADSMARQ